MAATWSEVPVGTVIEGWTLTGRTAIPGTDQVRLAMRSPDGSIVPVVKRADEPAPVEVEQACACGAPETEDVVHRPADEGPCYHDEAQAGAEAALSGQMEVEELATETAEEQHARLAATAEDPLALPPITAALSLRSHLYLLHDTSVADMPEGVEALPWLEKRHAEGHDTGPMSHAHVHVSPS